MQIEYFMLIGLNHCKHFEIGPNSPLSISIATNKDINKALYIIWKIFASATWFIVVVVCAKADCIFLSKLSSIPAKHITKEYPRFTRLIVI